MPLYAVQRYGEATKCLSINNARKVMATASYTEIIMGVTNCSVSRTDSRNFSLNMSHSHLSSSFFFCGVCPVKTAMFDDWPTNDHFLPCGSLAVDFYAIFWMRMLLVLCGWCTCLLLFPHQNRCCLRPILLCCIVKDDNKDFFFLYSAYSNSLFKHLQYWHV